MSDRQDMVMLIAAAILTNTRLVDIAIDMSKEAGLRNEKAQMFDIIAIWADGMVDNIRRSPE